MGISNWVSENIVWITLGISIIVLIYFIVKIIQQFRNKRQLISQINVILIIVGLLFLIFLTFNAEEVRAADWGQLILMIGLVTITANYAYSTEKMASEMREQRIMESRPMIIQRVVYQGIDWPDVKMGWTGSIPGKTEQRANYFSHFEIQNVGKGPAIGVEVSILDEKQHLIDSFECRRRTFLNTDDPPLKFSPSFPSQGSPKYYLACEYQNIISNISGHPTWHQTLLPFTPSKSSDEKGIFIATDDLEYKEEISETERINAFKKRT